MDRKCRRPNCPRVPRRHGLCYVHLEVHQRERTSRGEFVPGYVPAGPVQEHLAGLIQAGWTWRRLAKATGVTGTGLRKIPDRQNVWGTTAARILSLPLDAVVGTLDIDIGWVPAVGSMRRVQALNAIGYSLVDIAERTGIGWPAFSDLTLGKYQFVRARNAVLIDRVYRELQMTPAPPSRGASYARSRAAKRGWPPPFAWDDDIDDPGAQPQMPRGGRGAWFDDYLELKALGNSHDVIAERMGIQRDSLVAKLRRINAC